MQISSEPIRPLLSLAVPVRNGENYLGECLHSLSKANRGRYEIVVSNNCSTDKTKEILEKFQRTMPELKVVEAPRELTLAENLNFVAGMCVGTWIKFICHDDLLFPQAIDHITKALETVATSKSALLGNSEVHLFGSGYSSESLLPNDSPLEAECWTGRAYLLQFLAGGFPVPSLTTACVKRSVFDSLGKFDLKWQHLDTFLWCRLLLDHDFIRVKNALTVNRIHGGQVAAQVRRINRSMEEHRAFWPAFLTELKERQKVPLSTRIKLRLKWILVAATDAAIFSIKGNHSHAISVLMKPGIGYLPFNFILFVRARICERKRISKLMKHISIQEIYPG